MKKETLYGMWIGSVLTLLVCGTFFNSDSIFGTIADETIVLPHYVYWMAVAMAILPTIYLFIKVKKHMGEYKVARIAFSLMHFITIVSCFRGLILFLNYTVAINTTVEQHKIITKSTSVTTLARDSVTFQPQFATMQITVQHEPFSIEKKYQWNDHKWTAPKQQKFEAKKDSAKVTIKQGLLGFKVIEKVMY
ncbi:MAG: hypothetical protein GY810_29920 [Aureispira sp.]|nr:hypothetical protein [Aureispira sp.]